jgi:hypothetical protein
MTRSACRSWRIGRGRLDSRPVCITRTVARPTIANIATFGAGADECYCSGSRARTSCAFRLSRNQRSRNASRFRLSHTRRVGGDALPELYRHTLIEQSHAQSSQPKFYLGKVAGVRLNLRRDRLILSQPLTVRRLLLAGQCDNRYPVFPLALTLRRSARRQAPPFPPQ